VKELIKKSQKIILSTHRQCDGDGLGAELAIYYALKKIQKDVRIVNVDSTPRKYRFLGADKVISLFQNNPVIANAKLANLDV
jgi:phosphoesterase RecJ-like protein